MKHIIKFSIATVFLLIFSSCDKNLEDLKQATKAVDDLVKDINEEDDDEENGETKPEKKK